MGATTEISWTDATFNPWIGCQRVAPGCQHCYAEQFAKRYGKAVWGPQGTRVKTSESYWKQPLKWDWEAAKSVVRRRVFCASLADVFEDWPGRVLNSKSETLYTCTDCQSVIADDECRRCRADHAGFFTTMDDLRRDLFALIDATPNLDWLLLTKRPENIRRMWGGIYDPEVLIHHDRPPDDDYREWADRLAKSKPTRDNVWLGTSVSEQKTADQNIPELLKCRQLAPVLFASYEPALGPVDFEKIQTPGARDRMPLSALGSREPSFESDAHLDWIIVGGESGHGARPFDAQWARDAIRSCRDAGTACFVKQLGAQPLMPRDGDLPMHAMLRDSKGGDWNEWPEDLRVRQFPEVAHV